jgi:hypothetical protein
MSKVKTPAEIAADVLRAVAESKAQAETESPVNINNGTLYGGQSVTNVVVQGDYIPGNKQGKK